MDRSLVAIDDGPSTLVYNDGSISIESIYPMVNIASEWRIGGRKHHSPQYIIGISELSFIAMIDHQKVEFSDALMAYGEFGNSLGMPKTRYTASVVGYPSLVESSEISFLRQCGYSTYEIVDILFMGDKDEY